MAIDLGLFESRIDHEAEYPHPPARVWRALTESALLAEWLMENDLDTVEVGETFRFTADPVPPFWNGTVQCEILEVEPNEKLKISWWGEGGNPHTTVTWTLEPTDVGTQLTIAHEGLNGVRGFIMKLGMRGGWKTMYRESLPAVLRSLARGAPKAGADTG